MHHLRPPVKASAAPTIASVDVGTVRQRFNFDWATSDPVEGLDTYWWWARSIRVDPNEIIADDDEGGLWSIPFTTDGADAVTFGTPVRVRETYVPVDGDGVAATAAVTRRRQRVLASALDRPAKPSTPEHPSASMTGPEGQRGSAMDLTDLRARLGLGDDVDDATVLATALEQLPAPTTEAVEDTTVEPDPVAATQVPPVPPATASATELENAALRATVDRLAATEAARAQREAAEAREQVLANAVREGRITPHERTSVWEPFYDANAAAATEQLSKLPAHRVPLDELGHAAGAIDDVESRYAALTAGAPTYGKRG
jgi:hypothetical protein